MATDHIDLNFLLVFLWTMFISKAINDAAKATVSTAWYFFKTLDKGSESEERTKQVNKTLTRF